MRLLSRATMMLAAVVLVGCAPAADEAVVDDTQTVEEGPTVEEATAAITLIVNRFDSGVNAADADALAMLYTDDAVRMQEDTPVWIGNAAIREGFARGFEEGLAGQPGSWSVDNTVDDVVVAGESAITRGSFTLTFTPEGGGESTSEAGKWMSLSRREADGTWKIVWDIWNRDAPLAQQQ